MPKLIYLTFLISLFLIFLLPPTDPDLGWQLRCGKLFWTEHSFCEDNQFTVLLPDYSWPNHAWGYQALIYKIHQFFGLHGLTVFNALLMTAAFGFLFLTYRCTSAIYCALGILATTYFGWGVFSFGIRSQLMGFFFFNLTLYLLTKFKQNKVAQRPLTKFVQKTQNPATEITKPHHIHNKLAPRPLLQFVIPLVMLLWANTHGSVVLGLILIGYSILTTIATNLDKPHILKSSTLVGLASVAATLVNPFGFRIYEEMWRHFSGPIDLSKLIAEWVPPQPHIQQIILVSGTVTFVYLSFKSLRTPSFILNSLFLILPFAFWALRARRNVPFFFVVLTYSFLSTLKPKISPLRNQLTALLTVGVLLYGLIVQLPQTVEYDDCQRDVPCQAVAFLKEQEAGNIFNRYEWGGFLIWQLPEYKIFVDGRMPAWLEPENKSPYTIYLETLQTRPGWQETLDQYNITYILISPNTFMDLKLQPNPTSFGWQEIFRDKTSVIYRKSQTSF